MDLISKSEFFSRYRVDLDKPTILLTIHPETHSTSNNEKNVIELGKAVEYLRRVQFLITLPNADSENMIIREHLLKLGKANKKRIFCFENLGTQAYLSAMKNCSLMIGNSSSGIIEAASFGKWVIDLGDRQKGRICSKNVFRVPFEKSAIIESILKISGWPDFKGKNIYSKGIASKKIVVILKGLYEEICGFYNK
jgi:GDP/UDP-N,N'-diacetylbacillosamine 2-epimerase (hydrolysing)